jgi:hypothetical protein
VNQVERSPSACRSFALTVRSPFEPTSVTVRTRPTRRAPAHVEQLPARVELAAEQLALYRIGPQLWYGESES